MLLRPGFGLRVALGGHRVLEESLDIIWGFRVWGFGVLGFRVWALGFRA